VEVTGEDDDVTFVPRFFNAVRSEPRISAFIGSEEVGEQGTPHLQCYFELKNPMSMAQLHKWPCFAENPCALKVANGTAQQNEVYVMKDVEENGSYYEKWGQFSKSREGQGKRTDWDRVHELAREGASAQEFCDEVPHLAYAHIGKVPRWIKVHKTAVREWKTRPIIYFGPTRAGKSTLMRSKAAELADEFGSGIYSKSDSDKWWPDYNGEEVVIIDEMHGGFFQWQHLLRLFEEGPLKVQQKGDHCEFLARVVIMATNLHPSEWYKDRRWDESNAFRARIEEFGELHVFKKPTRNADGSKTFHPPVRDTELAPYIDPGPMESYYEGLRLLEEARLRHLAQVALNVSQEGVPNDSL
jgi:hypothetical protein